MAEHPSIALLRDYKSLAGELRKFLAQPVMLADNPELLSALVTYSNDMREEIPHKPMTSLGSAPLEEMPGSISLLTAALLLKRQDVGRVILNTTLEAGDASNLAASLLIDMHENKGRISPATEVIIGSPPDGYTIELFPFICTGIADSSTHKPLAFLAEVARQAKAELEDESFTMKDSAHIQERARKLAKKYSMIENSCRSSPHQEFLLELAAQVKVVLKDREQQIADRHGSGPE